MKSLNEKKKTFLLYRSWFRHLTMWIILPRFIMISSIYAKIHNIHDMKQSNTIVALATLILGCFTQFPGVRANSILMINLLLQVLLFSIFSVSLQRILVSYITKRCTMYNRDNNVGWQFLQYFLLVIALDSMYAYHWYTEYTKIINNFDRSYHFLEIDGELV